MQDDARWDARAARGQRAGSGGPSRRGPRTWTTLGARFGAIPLLCLLALLQTFGCVTSRVSNLDAYEEIPLSRVVPYPEPEELEKRSHEIVVVDRPSPGIDEDELERPRAQVRRALEAIAAESGATVIDRSLQEVSEIRTEGILSELEGEGAEAVSGADFALATRFSKYRYKASWEKPFKFPWQTPEDVANKPGTCTHEVDVELDVQLIEIGSNDRVSRTYTLEHSAEQSNKDLDPSCTIAPVTLSVLYETALDEALSCLELPLGRRLAPRGHVLEHRKAKEAERHIYRVSLGSVQGLEPGDEIEVRREQRATSPSGEPMRSERVISTGIVTDQVMDQSAWVAIDPTKAAAAILEGDVVRPVLSEGLLSSLSGPSCGSILTER